MTLISCPECHHQVSDAANNCPSCGYPISELYKNKLHSDDHKENKPITNNNEIVDYAGTPKNNTSTGKVILVLVISFLAVWALTKSCSNDSSELHDQNNESESYKYSKTINDSIAYARYDSINKVYDSVASVKKEKEESEFLKTKAGKVYKKHPEWSKEDCVKLSEGEIWIGMHYDMLVYLRGKPNNINASNYGRGNNYQACWNRFKPRCFYYDDRYIITAYN